jgi:hypothetical protein
VLNPAKLWQLVVLVMAISAAGHVALRVVGSRFGLPLAGFFAGFVSSTAAIAGFGQRVREQPPCALLCGRGRGRGAGLAAAGDAGAGDVSATAISAWCCHSCLPSARCWRWRC